MLKFMRQILRADKGATAVEYGLIVSLLVIAIVAALSGFADTTNAMLSKIDTRVLAASSN